jgi:predicted dehydrogenase
MTIEPRHRNERQPRIRLGMVGGGEGAYIGVVHRIAARLDDHYELVAGALSASPEKATRSGAALGLDPARAYPDLAAMVAGETGRPDGVEAVAIVTPNHAHADATIAFLAAGVHVICDKPLAATLEQARRMAEAAATSRAIFALTHNYTGYPLVRQARAMVAEGALGDLRMIQVEYPQEWLTEPIEAAGQKQAEWRTDPARAGASGCVADIGTHAYNLAGFVSGLVLEELSADVATFVPGRRVDDNVHVLLRYRGGVRGMLWASQVAPGHENGLRLRVYGAKGGLDWAQSEPNAMRFTPFGEPTRILTRSGADAHGAALRVTRVPAGHPEGYVEAFATLYAEVAVAIRAAKAGQPRPPEVAFPTMADGLDGMRFIAAVLESSAANGRWVRPGD